MRNIKVLVVITLALSIFACSKSDGFKNEAERSFMKNRGFETKAELDKYQFADPNERVKISAHNLARSTSIENAMNCEALIATAVLSNDKNNIGSESDREAVRTLGNMWAMVLDDFIQRGDRDKILSTLKEKIGTYNDILNSNNESYIKSWRKNAEECKKQVIPYFNDKEILSNGF